MDELEPKIAFNKLIKISPLSAEPKIRLKAKSVLGFKNCMVKLLLFQQDAPVGTSYLLPLLRGKGNPSKSCHSRRFHDVDDGLVRGFGIGVDDDGGVGLRACGGFEGSG